jgi:hypothetical protein
MQFFRFLSQRITGRALGLFLAYVLVAQSMLVPLRAIAAVTDHDISILCVTDSPLTTAGIKQDFSGTSHDPQMSHECDMGCVMQGSKAAIHSHNQVFTLLNLKVETSAIQIFKQLNVNGRPPSILAIGKAPGAPPERSGISRV